MADQKFKLLILFWIWIAKITGQFRGKYQITTVNTTATSNLKISDCSCDLTVGSCDISCCCDTDCPASTLKLWQADSTAFCNSVVFNELKPLTKWMNKDYLAFTNKRMGITIDDNKSKKDIWVTLDDGDNSGNYYNEINFKSTSDALTIFNRWFEWIDTSDDPEIFLQDNLVLYNRGDAVQQYYLTQNVKISFQFPSLGSFGNCEFHSNAIFGVDSEFKCSYRLTDVTTECPKYFSSLTYSTVNICRDRNCATKIIPTVAVGIPATAGIDCAGRITTLEFTFKFSEPTGSGFFIESIEMAYDTSATTLTNGQVADLAIKNKFINTQGNAVEKSGNPGYDSSKKLLLRNSGGGQIGYRKEIANLANGNCLTTPPTETIFVDYLKFNEAAFFQCSVSVADAAGWANNIAYTGYYLFSQFNQFGRYGDAEVTNGWFDIISPSISTTTFDSINKICTNMVTGIEYEILISQKGYRRNMQSYIVAINAKALQEDIPMSIFPATVNYRVAFTYFYVTP